MPKESRPVPADHERCQCRRPSTWPKMPSFMTLGPVDWTRCENRPTWIASDGEGEMSLCGQCKEVAARHIKAEYRPLLKLRVITRTAGELRHALAALPEHAAVAICPDGLIQELDGELRVEPVRFSETLGRFVVSHVPGDERPVVDTVWVLS